MKIILISGLSGSGKSVALNLLEDTGFYCVDNLPLEMLPDLVRYHGRRGNVASLGVSVDIRSGVNVDEARKQIAALREQGHQVEILFLEAAEDVLLRRFSETRRSHPLAAESLSLPDSLRCERDWLFPLRELAYCVDTSKLTAQQLRRTVQAWLDNERSGLMLVLESFGFKYGVPVNADFMFDMRSLPNPYWDAALRPLTGRDAAVRDFFAGQESVARMVDDIAGFLLRWLPSMETESRSYVTVAIGCTGGQHRSVYVCEQLACRLQERYGVLVQHRQLSE